MEELLPLFADTTTDDDDDDADARSAKLHNGKRMEKKICGYPNTNRHPSLCILSFLLFLPEQS